jgi:hypothetical protein
MNSLLARTGLMLAIALAISLAGVSTEPIAAAAGGERTCHLDAAEKRKTVGGIHRWTITQLDRWCVRDGRVISVRQTLEAEMGRGWQLVSKSGTARVTPEGTAISQGRFTLERDRDSRVCHARITGILRPDGTADYEVNAGC